MTNNQKKKKIKNEKNRKQENYYNWRKTRQYYSSEDSDNINYDTEEETDYGWKQVRKPNHRKQQHTPHEAQKYNTHDNITNRNKRHNKNNVNYTMEN